MAYHQCISRIEERKVQIAKIDLEHPYSNEINSNFVTRTGKDER